MTVKRIYDIDKIIVYEAKGKQIVDLAIKPSLTNQSVFSSKSIAHAVGWSITVEMIFYYNMDGKTTQGGRCIFHLTSKSKSVTLRSIGLKDKSSRKKKGFFVNSNIACCI